MTRVYVDKLAGTTTQYKNTWKMSALFGARQPGHSPFYEKQERMHWFR
jgi:hypothetical protein